MFEIEKAFDTLKTVASNIGDISKAGIEKKNLIRKKVLVNRGSKTFLQNYYVSNAPHHIEGVEVSKKVDEKDIVTAVQRHHEKFQALAAHMKDLSSLESHQVTTQNLADLRQKLKELDMAQLVLNRQGAKHDGVVPYESQSQNIARKREEVGFSGWDDKTLRDQKEGTQTKPAPAPERHTMDPENNKKVVNYDSYDHPSVGKINKGDSVTFDHKGESKTGSVVRVNVYQRFANPYVVMKGDDGKTYELVISKVNKKEASEPLTGREVEENRNKIKANLENKIKLMDERKKEK